MALKFRKSFKIVPGVRLNVGSKSAGLSFGGKGLRYSINSRTGGRITASIPGTGLSYSTSTNRRRYNSNAYQRREELRRQREHQKLEEKIKAEYEVACFENQIDLIKSIHKECDEPIYWDQIQSSRPPFLNGSPGPHELEARRNLENFKPGFFDKLFNNDSKRQELIRLVDTAKEKDKEDYNDWEKLVQVAQQISNGDIDTYFSVIDEMRPLDDLSDFGSGFNFGTDNPSYMEIEFQVHSDQVIPKEIKSLTSTGKLSTKAMPKSKYFDLEQDYVCSCTLRIARDMFALLPLDYVIIHAIDDAIDSSTGQQNEVTVLSVKIDRATLNMLNFENIDCSDSMQNFEHNMNFLKTSGFKPVERLAISL